MQTMYRPSQSDSELTAARSVWNKVFVDEIGELPPEQPWGSESGAQVFLAWQGETAIGAAQFTPTEPDTLQIEHVAVLQPFRDQKVGFGLIDAMIKSARSQHAKEVCLSARTDAQSFYAKHGFEAVGDEYEAFGSPHVLMRLPL